MVVVKKRSDGCWTCRLRRKKCDKRRPECGICKNLEINCHFTRQKPEWMIKGNGQREMAEKIKLQIKQNAASRRQKIRASVGSGMNGENGKGAFVIRFESDILESRSGSRAENSDSVSGSGSTSPRDIGAPKQDARHDGNALCTQSLQYNHEELLESRHRIRPDSCQLHLGPVLDALDYSMDDHTCSTFFSIASDHEIDFIMKYLDYVFPSLFPFYRPSIFETGRSWLLSLLRHNRIAFHSALSLTSYFFMIALTDAYGDTYSDCTTELWSRLETQIDRCFETIHSNVLSLNLQDKTASVLEKVHVMESITQVLMFEVLLGRSADWNLHLTPALALFEEVFCGANSHNSKMISVLHSISLPIGYKEEYDHYIWNPDQAGFRFFAALLIFFDVIASTALTQPPRLSPYYSDLLASQDDGAPILGFTHLRLSTVMGCQNSVVVAIGQIAALDAWKQDMKSRGSLSMLEVVERASPIYTSLNSTIDAFDSDTALRRPHAPPDLPFQSYAVRSRAAAPSTTTMRIWAHAAQLYLAAVVLGWQLSNAEVRTGVSRILELLRVVPSNHLRTLAWPLCVAGCLASVHQEQSFRNVLAEKKEVELVGSLNEARRVMEKVWEGRESVDPQTWDLTACFNILEKPVLLV